MAKCPKCHSTNYEITGTVWTTEECKACGFEHLGSSGIVREDFIKRVRENRGGTNES